jgi:hypothetical protein
VGEDRRITRALELGADPLMDCCSYELRAKPDALRQARTIYEAACLALLALLEHEARVGGRN